MVKEVEKETPKIMAVEEDEEARCCIHPQENKMLVLALLQLLRDYSGRRGSKCLVAPLSSDTPDY